MQEKPNHISFFATALTGGQKKRVLAAYCEYVSLVRNLEHIVRKHTVQGLANHQVYSLYTKYNEDNPWLADKITPTEQKLYEDFLNNKKIDERNYCFVSLNLSKPKDNQQGIISAPQSYGTHTKTNSLPHRIERYVAAFPLEAKLANTTFIINGKYVLTYHNAPENMSVREAFENELSQKRFDCILDIMAQFPENINNISPKENQTAQNETMASELTSPFENMILSTLSTLAEESNHALKDMICRRQNDNYIRQAENSGIIPSAARMQQYLNIRHLMRHQWDTLDNIGKFTFFDTEKNWLIRQRYLDGYGSLCDKPLLNRVEAYIAAAADFTPLVNGLNPEILIRSEHESNSKFINRIKEYVRQTPNQPLIIETAYSDKAEKKKALIKNIEKLFPNANIIDHSEIDIDSFCERIRRHITRQKFLEMFSELEYKISQYRLLQGKSQPVKNSWADLTTQKLLSAEETKQWGELRKLRNQLSHQHLDNELAEKLEKNVVPFFYATMDLENKLQQNQPQIVLLKDNIFRAIHSNGLIVDIDFSTKRILNATSEKKTRHQYSPKTEKEKKAKTYTEEYDNGVSITTAGSKIIACGLPDGTTINLNSQKIEYPDKTLFYFNSNEHCSLIVNNTKILIDNQFHIVNYISNGTSININKNETIILPNKRRIKTGNNLSIISDIWIDEKGNQHQQHYENKSSVPEIHFADKTILKLKHSNAVLVRNGIELTFANRKNFAESYVQSPNIEKIFQKHKQR